MSDLEMYAGAAGYYTRPTMEDSSSSSSAVRRSASTPASNVPEAAARASLTGDVVPSTVQYDGLRTAPPLTLSTAVKPRNDTASCPLKEEYTGLPEFAFVDPTWKRDLVPKFPFKICLIGDSNVGKSSLFINFKSGCHGTGVLQHASTPGAEVFVIFSPLVERTRTAVHFQIWDTAGQEKYKAITNSYMRAADVVVVVYDISNEDSLTNVAKIWKQQIRDHTNQRSVRLIFVGNKIDKFAAELLPNGDTIVTPKALKAIHKERLEREVNVMLDDSSFHFVSAVTGDGVASLLLSCKRICCEGNSEVARAIAEGEVAEFEDGAAADGDPPELYTGQPHRRGIKLTDGSRKPKQGDACPC